MEIIVIATRADKPPNDEINKAIAQLRADTGMDWRIKHAFTIVETRTPLRYPTRFRSYKEYISTATLECDDPPKPTE